MNCYSKIEYNNKNFFFLFTIIQSSIFRDMEIRNTVIVTRHFTGSTCLLLYNFTKMNLIFEWLKLVFYLYIININDPFVTVKNLKNSNLTDMNIKSLEKKN